MPSTPTLAGLGAVALLIIGLMTTVYVQHEKNAALTAELSTCTVANKTFADDVARLTADAAAAARKAAADRAALETQTAKDAADLAAAQKEIDRVASPADDRESPALKSAFGRLRAAAASTAPSH